MIGVTGKRTTLVQALGEDVERITPVYLPDTDRFVLAHGVLHGKQVQTGQELDETFHINATMTIQLCERIIAQKPEAAIVVIGSQSAIFGSFDVPYASAKAAVHAYVKFRKGYRINCVAPSIIADSGMTRRRSDYPDVLKNRKTVTAQQVADVVKQVLDEPWRTNEIVAV